jgi:hypothetical protein
VAEPGPVALDISGVAELVADPGKVMPRRLSQKYLGQDPHPEPGDVRRIEVRVSPRRVTGFGG